MNKNKQAIINTTANLVLTLINIIVTFFVTRIVLVDFGSDYNGLNTTINQIVGVMLIVESGIALSANVALYKPISEANKTKIEYILSAVNYVFLYVGSAFFLLGIIFSFSIPFFIKTSISYWEVVIIFVLTFVPIGLRLLVAVKYTTFLESIQKNYLVNFTKILANILILFSTFILSKLNQHYLTIKLFYFIWNTLAVFAIVVIFKKTYSSLKIGINKDLRDIKGVKDVLLKKVASVISSTYPALLLGILLGTNIVSVYGVYMLVISGLSSIIDSFATGPKDSLGLLLSEGDKKKSYDIFNKYTFIIVSISALFFSTAVVLMISFVKIYTSGVTDADYINQTFSIILCISAFVGAIQGPYTNILNGASIFKKPRIYQIVGAVVLLIIAVPLVHFFGIVGLAISVLVHNLIVTISKMIITYEYFKYGEKDLFKYLLFILVPQVIISSLLMLFLNVQNKITSYFDFTIFGIIIFLSNLLILFVSTMLPFKSIYSYFANRFVRKIRK